MAKNGKNKFDNGSVAARIRDAQGKYESRRAPQEIETKSHHNGRPVNTATLSTLLFIGTLLLTADHASAVATQGAQQPAGNVVTGTRTHTARTNAVLTMLQQTIAANQNQAPQPAQNQQTATVGTVGRATRRRQGQSSGTRGNTPIRRLAQQTQAAAANTQLQALPQLPSTMPLYSNWNNVAARSISYVMILEYCKTNLASLTTEAELRDALKGPLEAYTGIPNSSQEVIGTLNVDYPSFLANIAAQNALAQNTQSAQAGVTRLDQQTASLAGNLTAISGRVEVTQADIASEVTTRASEDTAIRSNIATTQADVATERKERIAGDTASLDAAAAAETKADTALTAGIALEGVVMGEQTARIAMDTELRNAVTAEATARDNEDKAIRSSIATTQADIAAETTARIAGDTASLNAVTAEATARDNEDKAIRSSLATTQSDVTAETTARIAGDTASLNAAAAAETKADTALTAGIALEGVVMGEQTARIAMDTELRNAVTAEATTRASEDTAIRSNIATIQADVATERKERIAGDTASLDAVTAEATARDNEDKAIRSNIATTQADIAAETTARIAGDTASLNAVTAEATARDNEDKAIRSNIATTQADIAAETTARIAGDTASLNAVTAEATARASEDTAIRSNIATTQSDVTAVRAIAERADTVAAAAKADVAAETTARTNDVNTVRAIAERADTTAAQATQTAQGAATASATAQTTVNIEISDRLASEQRISNSLSLLNETLSIFIQTFNVPNKSDGAVDLQQTALIAQLTAKASELQNALADSNAHLTTTTNIATEAKADVAAERAARETAVNAVSVTAERADTAAAAAKANVAAETAARLSGDAAERAARETAVNAVSATAERADTAAAAAKATAEVAQRTATAAQNSVDSVRTTAQNAETTATEAKTAAEAAQTTTTAAQTAARAAQDAARAAQDAARAAQDAAARAAQAAQNAETGVQNAATTVTEAKEAVRTAQNAATAAQNSVNDERLARLADVANLSKDLKDAKSTLDALAGQVNTYASRLEHTTNEPDWISLTYAAAVGAVCAAAACVISNYVMSCVRRRNAPPAVVAGDAPLAVAAGDAPLAVAAGNAVAQGALEGGQAAHGDRHVLAEGEVKLLASEANTQLPSDEHNGKKPLREVVIELQPVSISRSRIITWSQFNQEFNFSNDVSAEQQDQISPEQLEAERQEIDEMCQRLSQATVPGHDTTYSGRNLKYAQSLMQRNKRLIELGYMYITDDNMPLAAFVQHLGYPVKQNGEIDTNDQPLHFIDEADEVKDSNQQFMVIAATARQLLDVNIRLIKAHLSKINDTEIDHLVQEKQEIVSRQIKKLDSLKTPRDDIFALLQSVQIIADSINSASQDPNNLKLQNPLASTSLIEQVQQKEQEANANIASFERQIESLNAENSQAEIDELNKLIQAEREKFAQITAERKIAELVDRFERYAKEMFEQINSPESKQQLAEDAVLGSVAHVVLEPQEEEVKEHNDYSAYIPHSPQKAKQNARLISNAVYALLDRKMAPQEVEIDDIENLEARIRSTLLDNDIEQAIIDKIFIIVGIVTQAVRDNRLNELSEKDFPANMFPTSLIDIAQNAAQELLAKTLLHSKQGPIEPSLENPSQTRSSEEKVQQQQQQQQHTSENDRPSANDDNHDNLHPAPLDSVALSEVVVAKLSRVPSGLRDPKSALKADEIKELNLDEAGSATRTIGVLSDKSVTELSRVPSGLRDPKSALKADETKELNEHYEKPVYKDPDYSKFTDSVIDLCEEFYDRHDELQRRLVTDVASHTGQENKNSDSTYAHRLLSAAVVAGTVAVVKQELLPEPLSAELVHTGVAAEAAPKAETVDPSAGHDIHEEVANTESPKVVELRRMTVPSRVEVSPDQTAPVIPALTNSTNTPVESGAPAATAVAKSKLLTQELADSAISRVRRVSAQGASLYLAAQVPGNSVGLSEKALQEITAERNKQELNGTLAANTTVESDDNKDVAERPVLFNRPKPLGQKKANRPKPFSTALEMPAKTRGNDVKSTLQTSPEKAGAQQEAFASNGAPSPVVESIPELHVVPANSDAANVAPAAAVSAAVSSAPKEQQTTTEIVSATAEPSVVATVAAPPANRPVNSNRRHGQRVAAGPSIKDTQSNTGAAAAAAPTRKKSTVEYLDSLIDDKLLSSENSPNSPAGADAARAGAAKAAAATSAKQPPAVAAKETPPVQVKAKKPGGLLSRFRSFFGSEGPTAEQPVPDAAAPADSTRRLAGSSDYDRSSVSSYDTNVEFPVDFDDDQAAAQPQPQPKRRLPLTEKDAELVHEAHKKSFREQLETQSKGGGMCRGGNGVRDVPYDPTDNPNRPGRNEDDSAT